MNLPASEKVFVDANSLYSRTLRDWFCLIASQRDGVPPYHPLWSEDVIAEAVYHLRKEHPDWDGAVITKVKDRMARALKGGRVESYPIPPEIPGLHPGDRHVHAAAVAGNADYLLTCNVKHFPSDALYEVLDPDSFLTMVNEFHPRLVREVTRVQMEYWAQQRGEVLLPEYLRKAECPNFARAVRSHLDDLGGLPRGLPRHSLPAF